MEEKLQQRKLWDVQLEILDIIDIICRKNGLHYSLYAGTLIGAARHHGFIPWDDDLDVCMPRNDYESFLKIWNSEKHDGYILQNKRNTSSFTQSFTKIRKDHTTYLQFEWEKNRYHTGIFVDIFPLDRLPEGFFRKKKFLWECMRYQLYTREFVPPKASLPVKTISKLFLSLNSENKRYEYIDRFEQDLIKNSNNKELPVIAIETLNALKQVYPADLLDEYVDLTFEGKKYQCFKKHEDYLKIKYGDYMKLPPESERVWKHNHLIIDFDHNYGEEE